MRLKLYEQYKSERFDDTTSFSSYHKKLMKTYRETIINRIVEKCEEMLGENMKYHIEPSPNILLKVIYNNLTITFSLSDINNAIRLDVVNKDFDHSEVKFIKDELLFLKANIKTLFKTLKNVLDFINSEEYDKEINLAKSKYGVKKFNL